MSDTMVEAPDVRPCIEDYVVSVPQRQFRPAAEILGRVCGPGKDCVRSWSHPETLQGSHVIALWVSSEGELHGSSDGSLPRLNLRGKARVILSMDGLLELMGGNDL